MRFFFSNSPPLFEARCQFGSTSWPGSQIRLFLSPGYGITNVRHCTQIIFSVGAGDQIQGLMLAGSPMASSLQACSSV